MKRNFYIGNSGEKIFGLGALANHYFSLENNMVITTGSSLLVFWNYKTGEISDVISMPYHEYFYPRFLNDYKSMILFTDHCNKIFLWDLETKKEVRTYKGHEKPVVNVIIFDDGQRMLSCSEEGTIFLWDLESGEVTRRFEGHTEEIFVIGFSCEEDFFATCSRDKTIKIWNVETGELMRNIDCGEEFANDVDVSQDGSLLAGSFRNNTVKIWDVKTGMEIKTLNPNVGYISSICFMEDDEILEVISNANIAAYINLKTFKKVRMPCMTPNITDVTVEDEECRLYKVVPVDGNIEFRIKNNYVKIPDFLKNREFILEIRPGKAKYWHNVHIILDRKCKEFVEIDGDVEAFKNYRGTKNLVLIDSFVETKPNTTDFKLVDLETCKEVFRTTGYTGSSNSASFSPDGKILASGHRDGKLRLRDPETGEMINVFDVCFDYGFTYTNLEFSPCGRYLFHEYDLEKSRMLEVSTGKIIREFPIEFFSYQDGMITGIEDKTGNLCAWDTLTGEKVYEIKSEDLDCRDVRLNPDKKILAVYVYEGDLETVYILDMQTGEKYPIPGKYVGESIDFEGAAFSPDGKMFAMPAYEKKSVLVWDVFEKKEVHLFEDASSIYCIAFSPDSKLIAYAGGEVEISLRNLETGELIKDFTGHTSVIETLAFSPDGKHLASTSWDGTVRVWTV